MKTAVKKAARLRRHERVRKSVKGSESRPRLCVYRSLNHIYAQVIDDVQGHTLVAASTNEPELRQETAGKTKTSRAELVGTLLAKRAVAKGISLVAFDRGGYQYHGRIKALAEAARAGGLKF